jgi:hypothetical protein
MSSSASWILISAVTGDIATESFDIVKWEGVSTSLLTSFNSNDVQLV